MVNQSRNESRGKAERKESLEWSEVKELCKKQFTPTDPEPTRAVVYFGRAAGSDVDSNSESSTESTLGSSVSSASLSSGGDVRPHRDSVKRPIATEQAKSTGKAPPTGLKHSSPKKQKTSNEVKHHSGVQARSAAMPAARHGAASHAYGHRMVVSDGQEPKHESAKKPYPQAAKPQSRETTSNQHMNMKEAPRTLAKAEPHRQAEALGSVPPQATQHHPEGPGAFHMTTRSASQLLDEHTKQQPLNQAKIDTLVDSHRAEASHRSAQNQHTKKVVTHNAKSRSTDHAHPLSHHKKAPASKPAATHHSKSAVATHHSKPAVATEHAKPTPSQSQYSKQAAAAAEPRAERAPLPAQSKPEAAEVKQAPNQQAKVKTEPGNPPVYEAELTVTTSDGHKTVRDLGASTSIDHLVLRATEATKKIE